MRELALCLLVALALYGGGSRRYGWSRLAVLVRTRFVAGPGIDSWYAEGPNPLQSRVALSPQAARDERDAAWG
eukprot:864842-Pyramimonas_sp.AAC.1